MYLIYIGFYVLLALLKEGGSTIYKEGQKVPVNCVTSLTGTLVFWFRIKKDGPEFLFTTKNKDIKMSEVNSDKYEVLPAGDTMYLSLKSFNKKTDSGVYTCAAMNNNKLTFGKQTIIEGEPDPTPPPPKIIPATTKPKPDIVTTTQCACKQQDSKSVLNCETWIFSSLVAGCGFLLLLLVFTILYCNRLRTRRCPHHYKRQPQARPAGPAKLPNSHF